MSSSREFLPEFVAGDLSIWLESATAGVLEDSREGRVL